MALPQDGQNANALATVKEVPTGKKLIFVDPTTNEGGIITLEDLTTQILKKLTSQTFALDQGTKTLPAALNELNSKRLTAYARGTYDEVKINANGYALLTKDGIDLSECKFATMVNYANINPKTPITIYASPQRAYILGEPDTTIYGLEVDFWK